MSATVYASSDVTGLIIGDAFTLPSDCLAMADAAQEAGRRLRLHELAALRASAVAL